MNARGWSAVWLVAWLTLAPQGRADDTVVHYQKQLEAYYKQIRSIYLKYDQTVVSENNSDLLREVKEFAEKERQEALKSQPRNDDGSRVPLPVPLEHDRRASIHYELAEQFPSIALTQHAHLLQDGVERTESLAKFLHKNHYYQLSSHARSLQKNSSVDMSLFEHSPINAIGKRMYHSVNQPLSDLLLSPDATIVAGGGPDAEVIGIKAGPDFSDTIRPAKLAPGTFAFIHLKKSSPVYPLKIVFDMSQLKRSTPTFARMRESFDLVYEMSDYRDVPAGADGVTMPFPFHFLERDTTASTEWRIEVARINPVLPEATFVPQPPQGYSVMEDDRVPITIMKGGRPTRDLVAGETVAKARQLLAQPIPATRKQRTSLMLVLSMVTCVAIVGLIFVYRRR